MPQWRASEKVSNALNGHLCLTSPRPAGEPQVLLDGWDYIHDTHETLNTFAWGPDGWLYGCHGLFCPSLVGKPGAPEQERQWVDAAVWRYHPIRHSINLEEKAQTH
jgi:hypothetical protein